MVYNIVYLRRLNRKTLINLKLNIGEPFTEYNIFEICESVHRKVIFFLTLPMKILRFIFSDKIDILLYSLSNNGAAVFFRCARYSYV